MKKIKTHSIGFTILLFYTILSLINISFIVSVIFENQVELISKNIQLETERQLTKLISSMKKFTQESRKGKLFDIKTSREALDQVTEFIGPHFDGYVIFTEKKDVIHRSGAGIELPETFIEDGIRSVTAKTFSGNDYYLRIDEEKKMIYCYISLDEFRLGNYVILLQKNVASLNEALKNLYHQAIYIIIVVLLFHVIFAVILFRYIIHPINMLNAGAKKLSEGDLGARISLKRKDEFNTLAETFNRMAGSIDDKMKDLSGQMEIVKESKDRMENLAIRDELTGLFNRSYVIERTNEELKKAAIKKSNTAFLLADIDRFNEVNKIYGHQTGNIILMETAKTITRSCAATDVIGRFGGEEFAVLCTDRSISSIQEMAEQIRAAVEKNVIVTPDGNFSVTVSIGISCIDAGHLNTNNNHDLPGTAERALLRAKENGRNRIELIM
ncbi:MAG: diguanylate cyclase [Spirochaetes bacterium]|nr:diguanylate cyclase [Spirochaetota bacterium]